MNVAAQPRPHHARAGLRGLALIAVLVCACGDDDGGGDVDRDAAPQAERDASPPARDAGSPDAAVDAGLPPALPCMVSMCSESGVGTPGCCTARGTGVPGHLLENTGRAAGLCGTDLGELIPSLAGTCLQLAQPGEPDSECPAQAALSGGVRMRGCCTDEGFCGSLETAVGLGCFYGTGRKGRRCTPDPQEDAGM